MHLFGNHSFLDPELEEGLFETWTWLMGRFGNLRQMARDPLITPTSEYFPATSLTGDALASQVLQTLRRLMKAEVECDVQPMEARGLTPDEDGPPLIAYSDATQPWLLVSELAHGVAGAMLAPFQDDLPEGKESFWPTASLLVVHKGLGLFALNGAVQVVAIGRLRRKYEAGYLSEQTFAFLLAAYLALTNRVGAADQWVRPTYLGQLHEAQKHLTRNPGLLPS